MKLQYLALSLILCATASIARRTAKLAPLYTPQAAQLLEDSYIVILKSDVPEKRFNAHMNALEIANFARPVQGANSGLEHVFNNDIVKGYSGKFSEDVVEMIRRRPEVDYVERDQIMRVAKTQERVPWVGDLRPINYREYLLDNRCAGSCSHLASRASRPRKGIPIRVCRKWWRGRHGVCN